MSKTFTKEDVAQHNKDGDVWVIIDGGVYDLSKFAKLHPGGKAAILHPEVAGKDATDQFYSTISIWIFKCDMIFFVTKITFLAVLTCFRLHFARRLKKRYASFEHARCAQVQEA